MTLPNLDTWMLIVATAAVAIVVGRWQRDPANQFDIVSLVTDSDTGRVSLFKTGQLLALLVSTWGFVVLTRADRLTEWYFAGYMLAWAGANVAKIAIDAKKPKDPT